MSELEIRIGAGDRDAMVRYLVLSLGKNLPKDTLRERWARVWNADHGADTGVLVNLGWIAAEVGRFDHCMVMADAFRADGLLTETLPMALALKQWGGASEQAAGQVLQQGLAGSGHILSQVLLRREQAQGRGLPGKILFLIYWKAKLVQAWIMLLRNPEDRRAKV